MDDLGKFTFFSFFHSLKFKKVIKIVENFSLNEKKKEEALVVIRGSLI